MARTVERIEEDIAALEEALSTRRRNEQHSSYLTTLGPAVTEVSDSGKLSHMYPGVCKTLS